MDFLPDTSFRDLPEPMQRDYFQSPRGLGRWLRRLTWAAFLGSVAFVGYTFLPGQQTAYQAGPLTRPHQFFENDCSKCHTAPFGPLARLVSIDLKHRSTPDAACVACHDGPPHQQGSKEGGHPQVKAEYCASCHREHHGRDALLRISDSHCVACHGNLDDHIDAHTKRSHERRIVDFASHPEFAVLREKKPDPGSVFFNHKKHMELPGLDPGHARLKEQGCVYCHQPDQAGKAMKPIRYQDHCQSCHPLRATVEDSASLPHPHPGETAEVVRAALRQRLTQIVQTRPEVLKAKADTSKNVPRDLGPSLRPAPIDRDAADWINAQQVHGERVLFDGAAGCRYCHAEQSIPERRINGLPDYGKPSIPSRWMPHANFDHQAHRFLDCTTCHKESRTSGKEPTVMMPSIAICQSCHQAGGGAKSDCVECHTYHTQGGHFGFRGQFDLEKLGRKR